MAALSHSESRRLYSWWWDSHISPKNSKWLQENLTDMDIMVKAMIKLLEEDADSFARRAEMYYKKRPELMKLVEEFYRAYRALAERYDHATGALRQAHRTMAEVFPNQIPLGLSDDSPSGSSGTEVEPHTPEMPAPIRALFEPDDLHKDALGLSSQFHAIKRNGAYSEESDVLASKMGLKQLNEMFVSGEGAAHGKFAEGRVRKGLNFHDKEGTVSEHKTHDGSRDLQKHEAEKENAFGKTKSLQEEVSQLSTENQILKTQIKSESERASNAETEVQRLQEALSKLEAEKEATFLQYQQSLERISDLETEISRTLEDSRKLNGEMLIGVTRLNSVEERCLLLEKENQSLQLELRILEQKMNEQHQELHQKQDELEKLKTSIQDELIRSAQAEVSLQYLEKLHAQSQEELRISALEIKSKVEILKDMEMRKQVLEDDLCLVKEENDHLNNELKQKLEELEKLNIAIQDECLRSLQGEAALKSLEKLYSQSQEEKRVLDLDVQSKFEILKDMELRKQSLEEEVRRIKEENENLNEQNLSFAVMIKKLQDQILSLEEAQEKLENKVEINANEKKVLQQELSLLKEEMNDLNERHRAVMEQIEAVGFDAESLQASVKDLQNVNIELKEICKKHEDEKVLLLEKLGNMEKVSEKNAVLENSLSDATVELEGLRENIKALEESCESLDGKNSSLISEKGALVLQIETIIQNMDKLSDNNTFLENSLSDANAELEGLRGKLKSLEESFQSLHDEKSNLLTEKNTLVSLVESIRQSLENLEKRYAELEDKHSDLEKEKELALHQVSKLQDFLKIEKQEHETLILSTKTQLATLEDQIILLQEKGQCREEEFWKEKQEHETLILSTKTQLATLKDQIILLQEKGQYREEEFREEEHKLVGAYIEIFILQKSVCDLKERNLNLARECQKHLEGSRSTERLVTDLKQQNLLQHRKVESLSVHNEKLREGIYWVLKTLDIDKDYGFSDGADDGLHWQLILDKIKEMRNSISDAQDENQNLFIEKSVIITLLWQLGLDVAELKSTKSTLEQESKIRNKELSVVQSEKHELLEMHGQLRQDIQACYQREEVLKAEMKILGRQLLHLQETCQMSQAENLKLLGENQSLSMELFDLREEKNMLEEENGAMLMEAMTLHCLSLIFEQYNVERAMDLKMFSDDLYSLNGVNNDLEEKVRKMVEKTEVLESENLHLKESATNLEVLRSHLMIIEDDLNMARHDSEELNHQIEQLNHQIETGKNMLIQKDMELSEVNQKFQATQNQNLELHENLEDLKMELDKAKTAREELEKNILVLSEVEVHKDKEIACSHESNKKLGLELHSLHKQVGELRIRENHLTSELANEMKCYEEEVATLCNGIHISTVHAVLFEEKFLELIGTCESLEINAMVQRKMLEDEITSRSACIDELSKKINDLEEENVELNSKLNEYLPLVLSLCDSISRLEDYTLSFTKRQASNNQKIQDDSFVRLQHDKYHKVPSEYLSRIVPDGILELRELQAKVEALLEVLAESCRLLMQENFDANTKLEAARKEIEELKLKISSSQAEVQMSMDIIMQLEEKGEKSGIVLELKNDDVEVSKVKPGVMMKDIQLDHVSSSSYEVGVSSYENGRIENAETDDQMLELWETAERDCNNKTQKAPLIATKDDLEFHQIEAVEEEKSEYPSSELVAEKELGVDKLEVLKKDRESHEEWNKRVLERLASDAERLSVLQTNVQELKNKMEKSEKSNHSASPEYDTVKGQLKEAEEAILQLFDINSKLTKKAEDCSASSDRKVGEHEEMSYKRERQVLERARRASEKIGRLELELQKIQYILLKLQEEHENHRAKAVESRSRILLRDYLYGRRESYRRKKGHLCGCIRPKTRDD